MSDRTPSNLLRAFAHRALDSSIAFSFDRTGFRRHAREFKPADLAVDLTGREVVVTGANSGIGYATSHALASLGARVHMLCRNLERGEAARARLAEAGEVVLHIVDVSSKESVLDWCAGGAPAQVDVLIHNAGALLDGRLLTDDGLEMTLATHVVGPLRLTAGLVDRMPRGGRVVWVSSGGMYGKKLSLDRLGSTAGSFDGVGAYADAKRAQVVLSEQLAKRLSARGITSNAMHPGWVTTPGVVRALPAFYALTRAILRSPHEGADTVVWLAGCKGIAHETGRFWFDRRAVPTHLRTATRESPQERDRLWSAAWGWAGVEPPPRSR
jgi:NAD(P)-dependent dehydrogenase (short-subunit alcohol dehydrogenase family)